MKNKLSGSEPKRDTLIPAKNLLLLLAKTLKSIKVYPENSPVLKGIRELLYKEFQSYLSTFGDLPIRVMESALQVDGQVVYEEESRSKGLAFILYRDGLREINFYEGLTQEELNEFLEVLLENWGEAAGTDMVGSLWERDFHYISYLAIDELFNDLMKSLGESEVHPDQPQDTFSSPASSGKIVLREEDKRQDAGRPQRTMKGVEAFPEVGSSLLLNDEDIQKIREIVEEDRKNFNPSREFAIALLSLLALEDDPVRYVSILRIFKDYLTNLISNSDFGTASWIFSAFNEMKNSSSLPQARYRSIEKSIVKITQTPGSIEKIRRSLQEGAVESLEDLLKYTFFLGKDAVPILVDILMLRENQRVLSEARDLLVKFGREDIEYVGRWVSDGNSRVVREVVSLLGQLGEEAIPYLGRCLHHPEADVRRETVRSLSRIGGVAVNSILNKFLLDPDTDVRIITAKAFDTPGPETVKLAIGVIAQKGFNKRGLREKRAWIEVLRKAGTDDAVAVLDKLLHQKSWFRRGESDDLKMYVVSALSKIGTTSAREVLAGGTRMRNKRIRKACQAAVQGSAVPETKGEKGEEI